MTISCQICRAEFFPITGFEETNQAYRCASSVFTRDNKQYVIGYYGSTVADGKLFRVEGRELEHSSICDDCVEQMISNRSLVCLSEFNLWGVNFNV